MNDYREGKLVVEVGPCPTQVGMPIVGLPSKAPSDAKKIATDKIAMLLPVEFLHGATRYELFQDRHFPLKVVYVFSSRLCFGSETHATLGHGWYVWDHRYRGEPRLRWIR
jgi:hypothetical protein